MLSKTDEVSPGAISTSTAHTDQFNFLKDVDELEQRRLQLIQELDKIPDPNKILIVRRPKPLFLQRRS